MISREELIPLATIKGWVKTIAVVRIELISMSIRLMTYLNSNQDGIHSGHTSVNSVTFPFFCKFLFCQDSLEMSPVLLPSPAAKQRITIFKICPFLVLVVNFRTFWWKPVTIRPTHGCKMVTHQSLCVFFWIILRICRGQPCYKPCTVNATLQAVIAPSSWLAPRYCPTRTVHAPPVPSATYRTVS